MTRQSITPITPITPVHSTFHVRKIGVARMLQSIAGNPGRYPGDPTAHSGLQGRTDLSGKQARQLAQNRRALQRAQDDIEAERQALIQQHTKRYPPDHTNAGEVMPIADANLADVTAFQKDIREMLDETVAVTCPGFSGDDLDKLAADGKSPLAAILDPLYDLEVGGATSEEAVVDKMVALVDRAIAE